MFDQYYSGSRLEQITNEIKLIDRRYHVGKFNLLKNNDGILDNQNPYYNHPSTKPR